MSGFFTQLLENLRRLPARLWTELRPGAGEEPGPRRSLFFHLHPARVHPTTLRLSTTFGLGVASLTLFALLTASGVLLMFFYEPSATGAYPSILDLQYAVPWGRVVRAVHRWAGHALVLCVFLHVLRVVFSAAWRRRELNWLLGLGQGLLVLALAFTGYLLPWDQLSYWAVRVSAGLLDNFGGAGRFFKILFLGGEEVGPPALLRFYTLHVALLPALLGLLVLLHLWRIRRDGGLARENPPAPDQLLPSWPALYVREAALAAAVVFLVLVAGILFPAPVGTPLDASMPSNPEKAPWYFLGLQEMVSHSAFWGGAVLPVLAALTLLLLPWLDREDLGVGTLGGTPVSRRWVVRSALAALAATAVMEWLWIRTGGTLPEALSPPAVTVYLGLCVLLLGGVFGRSTRAAFLAAAAFAVTALVCFTLVGMWRGPDWKFFWPWESWPGGF